MLNLILISTLNALFKSPQIYELVFPIKNPYAFKKFYFTISINSEESQTSSIRLSYSPKGVLSDSLFIEQKSVFGQRGGINVLSLGFKNEDLQVCFKYNSNEMIYIGTSEENQFKQWDIIFGKIRDTLYPSDIQGLDRSIVVEYNFDSLYRRLNLTSFGEFSIFSNPVTVELGYKNFLISFEGRFIDQKGNLIEYNVKNYYISSNPKVSILNYSNYKWLAYLYAIPVLNDPFRLSRKFDIENTFHFSFYLSYFDNKTLLRLGYSPELTIKGSVKDEISYITSISNEVDSIKYDKSYLYAYYRNDTVEILNYAVIFLYFKYKDTTYTNLSNFSYKIPSSIIFEFYKHFNIRSLTLDLFFGQKPLKNLYLGSSIMHRFYAKTLANYGYIYTKNNILTYHMTFFNMLVPTGSFLFSFGAKLSFYNSSKNFIENAFKNYIVSIDNFSPFAFSLNFQINYIR